MPISKKKNSLDAISAGFCSLIEKGFCFYVAWIQGSLRIVPLIYRGFDARYCRFSFLLTSLHKTLELAFFPLLIVDVRIFSMLGYFPPIINSLP